VFCSTRVTPSETAPLSPQLFHTYRNFGRYVMLSVRPTDVISLDMFSAME